MEYTEVVNGELGFSFKLPAAPTVMQVLRYDSRRFETGGDAPAFVVLWECAKTVISDWQCELLPDMKVDLDTLPHSENLARQARIIEVVGIAVSGWRNGLDSVPKN